MDWNGLRWHYYCKKYKYFYILLSLGLVMYGYFLKFLLDTHWKQLFVSWSVYPVSIFVIIIIIIGLEWNFSSIALVGPPQAIWRDAWWREGGPKFRAGVMIKFEKDQNFVLNIVLNRATWTWWGKYFGMTAWKGKKIVVIGLSETPLGGPHDKRQIMISDIHYFGYWTVSYL